MADYSRLFHTGVRVPDIAAAMDEYGGALGLTWAQLQHRQQGLWTPDRGAHTVDLLFTYSCEGPVHIELLQGEPDTFWDGRNAPGAHHIGLWSDDVAADTQAMIEGGCRLVGAGQPPEAGYGLFSYVAPTSGLIIELVSSAAMPMFDRWWAGGAMA